MVGLSLAFAAFRRRPIRAAGTAVGVALAVALMGSLGAFMSTAKSQMTRRAVEQVAVDWQVEVQPGAAAIDVAAELRRRAYIDGVATVRFGSVAGFEATGHGTTQSTGPGVVVGLPDSYRRIFPSSVRTLAGSDRGVLLAQQTAANLRASPGDVIVVKRSGLAPATVVVEGVIDLPAADSLFQKVGAAPGAQLQAPPDNVLVVSESTWSSLFLGATAEALHTQVHARLNHHLPADPAAAFSAAAGAARRFEADVAGSAVVGNNLAATLDAARSDALYAQVLFVLLGLPGLLLAMLLTRAVAVSDRRRRRSDLALLRARGASSAQVQRIVVVESLLVGSLGAGLGLVAGAAIGRVAFHGSAMSVSPDGTLVWAAASFALGLLVTVGAAVIPAWRDAQASSVATARQEVGRSGRPLALRLGLDGVLLAGAALVLWASSRSHYNLVLAPEGVPTVSVSYWSLGGPLLLWGGFAVLVWRAVDSLLDRGRQGVRALLRPVAGRMRGPAASTLRRQRALLAPGVVLVALSAAFAISTSVFNTTYRRQVGVDALLTNGAPVTVSASPGAAASDLGPTRLSHTRGVRHVEPLVHRYVYVGPDLQDLFGVRPRTIGRAGQLQDSYFSGGSVRTLMGRLASHPDAALVSAETVKDFQLQPGDHLHFRVRRTATGELVDVNFRFAGVVKEFPTAPTDSFVVANADYIAQQTGDPIVSTFLISTTGSSPHAVARRVQAAVGSGARVSNIEDSRRVVGSSLTAVDLSGLTRIELAYALVMMLAACGLVLALGLAQRQRSYAILGALGARRGQIASFARSEAAVFGFVGGGLGVAGGWLIAHTLVKVLTGVFDPAPTALAVPFSYLLVLALGALAGLVLAVRLQLRGLRPPLVELVRDL